MNKPMLSVIVPGLNEEFMQNTIDSILENSGPRTEVICILDGYWPAVGIKGHDRLRIIHNENPIGQRQATNQGARLSEAKYVMKLDAHCAVSKGFDEELMRSCKYDWTMIPRMYTLDAFHWVCRDCSNEHHQGAKIPACEMCGKTDIYRKIIWKPKERKRTDYMWINDDMRMKYFDRPSLQEYGNVPEIKKRCDHKKKPWSEGAITDVMTCIGAGFFMHRKRYWELGGMDEGHGSWGQMAVELSMKAWLSGGRMVVNKNCWFAHLARTGKGFGFPYKHKRGAIEKARSHSKNTWLNGTWPQAIHKYDWLVKKFAPLPGWKKEQEGTWDIEPPQIHEPYPGVANNLPTDVDKSKKSVIYYTDNQCDETIAQAVRKQILKCTKDCELISVSLKPIDFGKNIVVNEQRSVLTMFKQILIGLEAAKGDIAYLVEHDVMYHPDHFKFIPPKDNVYYFDENVWKVDAKTGKSVFYLCGKTSQLCANRELLIKHYKKKIQVVEENGFTNRIGYEPGNRKVKHGGIDDFKREMFKSPNPNLDIRHGTNLTKNRFKKSQFRKEPQNWTEAHEVPYWGVMKDGGFYKMIESILSESDK